MLFGTKTKGFCVEFGEQTVLLARLSESQVPMVVEELKEFSISDSDGLANYLATCEGKGPTGFAHAKCSVLPARRLIRRHTLDLKRLKEPTYLNEVIAQQFRVEAEKFTTLMLNPADGTEFDATKSSQKEALFCGMPTEEIGMWQEKFLEFSIYPERLELSTVATLGALVSYQKFKQSKTPLLLLEIGEDTTQSFIVSSEGVEISRPIPNGIAAMIPVVQRELGLKDEESAKKLFHSNSFDFTSMGATLVKKLLKELQSSIGFYEVQTGQSIGHVLSTQLPPSLAWLSGTIGAGLGVTPLKVEIVPWTQSLGITLAPSVQPAVPDERWLGLFGLMASFQNGPAVEKT
ncbi:MAG: hypothetical protein Q8J74_12990 [Candidatus Didemnitutus sp.]|nr:hypothetical protein [Candidatus Didemnitutus sp.]